MHIIHIKTLIAWRDAADRRAAVAVAASAADAETVAADQYFQTEIPCLNLK